MSYAYIDTLNNETKKRYEKKLSVAGLNECPYRMAADKWLDNPTQWPRVEWPDIYHYLVQNPGPFTHEAMKNFRSLDAHYFFRSGFVGTTRHVSNGGNMTFLAEVKPSQRLNDPCHKPWLTTNTDGVVLVAHCTCMAGLGESCTHVAAVLFKIEAAVRLGYTTLACTDMPCQWNNQFVSKVIPAPIAQIKMYREEAVNRVQETGYKRRATASLEPPSYEEQQQFLISLLTAKTKPVALSLFKETCVNFKQKRPEPVPRIVLPKPLRSHFSSCALSEEQLKEKRDVLLQDMGVSREQVEYVDSCTTGQADNLTWREQRAGRITASTAYSVLHTNQQQPATSVLLNITREATFIKAQALEYGRKQESVMFSQYEKDVSTVHRGGKITKCGTRIHLENPWLSASADGIVVCECHGRGVLEIKCPLTLKDKTKAEVIADPKGFMFNGVLQAKHQYFVQVQIQMCVYDVDFADFLVQVKDGYIYHQLKKNTTFLDESVPILHNFWKEHVVNEILTRSVENRAAKPKPPVQASNKLVYCYCQEEEDDRPMVGCDGENCPYQWVHLECIRPKRKTVPKGNWYCKNCKSSSKATCTKTS